jgi:hypothetical protein
VAADAPISADWTSSVLPLKASSAICSLLLALPLEHRLPLGCGLLMWPFVPIGSTESALDEIEGLARKEVELPEACWYPSSAAESACRLIEAGRKTAPAKRGGEILRVAAGEYPWRYGGCEHTLTRYVPGMRVESVAVSQVHCCRSSQEKPPPSGY